MNKITPFIWFDKEAEEAANFYVSIFPNSKITSLARYDKAGAQGAHMTEGAVMTVGFELDGVSFTALNGGKPAGGPTGQGPISFVVHCQTQEEIDHYWDKLGSGGRYNACGWLTDRFGIAWQVVPDVLPQYLTGSDKSKAEKVIQAMFKMQKIDISELEKAYNS